MPKPGSRKTTGKTRARGPKSTAGTIPWWRLPAAKTGERLYSLRPIHFSLRGLLFGGSEYRLARKSYKRARARGEIRVKAGELAKLNLSPAEIDKAIRKKYKEKKLEALEPGKNK